MAEKTGLIIRLGEWSLLAGARQASHLAAAGHRTKVAINVSRAQLASPKFAQALHAALLCANVSPDLIELELTESLFMDISETVQANLCAQGRRRPGHRRLRHRLLLPGQPKDIPATKLKLDRAFVVVLPEDRRALRRGQEPWRSSAASWG